MKAVEQDLGKVSAWSEQHQRPIYIGEFGSFEKADMALPGGLDSLCGQAV